MKLVVIVEGHGEIQAAPILIRNILHHHQYYGPLEILPQRRKGMPGAVRDFENNFNIALKEADAVLLLLDFDCKECDCVAAASARFYEQAQGMRADMPFKVAFMVKEFESLFLANPEATRKVLSNIPADLPFPADPESVRDAKGWLSKAMPSGYAYKETVDQAKLTAALDLDYLRAHSPSYRHLEKSLLSLLGIAPVQNQEIKT